MSNKKTPPIDVAISFAGEDRDYVEKIARALQLKGLNVFYDEDKAGSIIGKDLDPHLTEVYQDEAKYCLMVISKHYAEKTWTNHERKAALARALMENYEYIIPLRLDDTEIEGILPTVAYLNPDNHGIEKIVQIFREKVEAFDLKNGVKYPIVLLEDALRKINIKAARDKFANMICPSCKVKQVLTECKISLIQKETFYECKNGCQTILVIGRPGEVAWEGRGYGIGDHVIRNITDINYEIPGTDVLVNYPARPNALKKKI